MSLTTAGYAVVAVATFLAGWLLCRTFSSEGRERYVNPELHQGRWSNPEICGSGDQTRVVWKSMDPQPDGREIMHTHKAADCTVGPGMAHVDMCACGAKRYGVFGPWS